MKTVCHILLCVASPEANTLLNLQNKLLRVGEQVLYLTL